MREGRRKALTARIIELHRRGKRPIEIQSSLGVSRGMVAGILYRFRAAPAPKTLKSLKPKLTPRPIVKGIISAPFVEVHSFDNEPRPMGDVAGGCRWIHGPAPGRNFCGAQRVPGTAWCGHHRARVFVKVVVRK